MQLLPLLISTVTLLSGNPKCLVPFTALEPSVTEFLIIYRYVFCLLIFTFPGFLIALIMSLPVSLTPGSGLWILLTASQMLDLVFLIAHLCDQPGQFAQPLVSRLQTTREREHSPSHGEFNKYLLKSHLTRATSSQCLMSHQHTDGNFCGALLPALLLKPNQSSVLQMSTDSPT